MVRLRGGVRARPQARAEVVEGRGIAPKEVDVEDVIKLNGEAQLKYVIDDTNDQKYWDYVVGQLGVDGSINLGALQFDAAAKGR